MQLRRVAGLCVWLVAHCAGAAPFAIHYVPPVTDSGSPTTPQAASHSAADGMKPSPPGAQPGRLVLPVHGLGLANRLRTMGCASVIAEDSHRRLSVDWLPSASCKVALSDLVAAAPGVELYGDAPDSDPPIRYVANQGPVVSTGHGGEAGVRRAGRVVAPFPVVAILGTTVDVDDVVHRLRHTTGCRQQAAKLDGVSCGPPSPPSGARPTTSSDTFVLQATGAFRPLHMSCQEFLRRRSAFYRALQPVQWVRDAVARFHQQHFAGHMTVGVHIRVHNNEHDWTVVPAGGGRDNLRFEEASPVHLFVRAVEEVLQRHPGARVFLATNNAGVRVTMAAHFGADVVRWFEPDDATAAAAGLTHADEALDPGVGAATKLAFIDWLLLARASLILGTFYSSFSEEAALVNLTPRIMVRAGGNVAGFDLRKPDCGYLYDEPDAVAAYQRKLSARNASSLGAVSATPPGDVLTHTTTLDACDHMTAVWGVTDVYC